MSEIFDLSLSSIRHMMVAVVTLTSIPKMEIGQNMPRTASKKKKLDLAAKHIHRDNDNAESL